MKDSGSKAKEMELAIFRYKGKAFMKALSKQITELALVQRGFPMLISIRESIKRVSSMEKEYMCGLQGLAMKAISSKDLNKAKENGNLGQEISI